MMIIILVTIQISTPYDSDIILAGPPIVTMQISAPNDSRIILAGLKNIRIQISTPNDFRIPLTRPPIVTRTLAGLCQTREV